MTTFTAVSIVIFFVLILSIMAWDVGKRLAVELRKLRYGCPNCKEKAVECQCMRNKCRNCGQSVGNITFTYCDDCWETKTDMNKR